MIEIEFLSDSEDKMLVEMLQPFRATAATAMAPPPVTRIFNLFASETKKMDKSGRGQEILILMHLSHFIQQCSQH